MTFTLKWRCSPSYPADYPFIFEAYNQAEDYWIGCIGYQLSTNGGYVYTVLFQNKYIQGEFSSLRAALSAFELKYEDWISSFTDSPFEVASEFTEEAIAVAIERFKRRG